MRQTVGNEETGIKWTHTKNLEDLDFADDICLISHKLEDMQAKSNKLAEEASKIGLQVNIEKTEVMKIPGQHHQQQQQQQQTTISINGRNLKETTSFTYLPGKHRFNYRRTELTRISKQESEKQDKLSLLSSLCGGQQHSASKIRSGFSTPM
ncbi:unnamed protein product [Trichobilharzia szidati]|nr:unnamed protein product [Trichobilharzia szidati]